MIRMNESKRIVRSLIVVSCMLLLLVFYLLYFNLFKAPEIRKENRSTSEWTERIFVRRGKIYDAKGRIIAETGKNENDKTQRLYPEGNLFSGIVGFCYKNGNIGKSFLEKSYDAELLMKSDHSVFNMEVDGTDLHLTIDRDFQQYVYEQMQGKDGSIVAMDPQTGEILAMVSLPDYDPSDEAGLERMFAEDENAAFLNMIATRQPTFPASTFKIITAAAAIENGLHREDYYDTGAFDEKGVTIRNAGGAVYKNIDIEEAFEKSCNSYFCNVAYELGIEKMSDICSRFGFDKEIPFDIPVVPSTIYSELSSGREAYSESTDCAYLGIGQAVVKATPLHMAMICSTIANDGVMAQPFMVKDGRYDKAKKGDKGKRVISEECADLIGEMMEGVVKRGTGRSAQIDGVTVAGKTGTAETGSTSSDHAWFLGYAPAENPQIAVAVFFRHDGRSGGSSAGPVAKKVMEEYLTNYNGK